MEKKQNILEYRKRLDETLASHNLVNDKFIRNLVKNQLISSSSSDTHGDIENFLDKRTTEVSNFLDMLRSSSGDDTEVLKSDGMPHREWKLKQDNEDFRVMYREGPEGTPFHTLLVEGYVDAPLDVCLGLSWEVALFKKWWPHFHVPPFKVTMSDCLQEVRIGEQITQMRLKVAWPLSARETILHYFELEYFEDDLIIVLLKSISDTEDIDKSTHGFSRDGIPDAKDFVRIDVVGGFVLQKVTPSISYFRTITTMDIKLDFVPPSLINFLSRQLIGSGFKLYKKTVASIAKGDDEDFRKALEAPIYVRVREGLTLKNNLEKTLENDTCLEEHATKIPPVDTMGIEQISLSESHATTSSQAGIRVAGQTYNEIEEVEVEEEKQSVEDGQTSHGKIEIEVEQAHSNEDKYSMGIEQISLGESHATTSSQAGIPVAGQTYNSEIEVEVEAEKQSVEDGETSHGKIEVEVKQQTHSNEDKHAEHSSTNLTIDTSSKEKALISPDVEQALRVLDHAISMVRKGFSIQSWSVFGSSKRESLHMQRVATEVGSASPGDRSDDGVSLKAPKVNNTEALWEDESSSGFFDIRHDKQESPVREANDNLTLESPKRISSPLNTAQNGKVLEAAAFDNMSSGFQKLVVQEGIDNGGEFRQKKQRRCCLYFLSPKS